MGFRTVERKAPCQKGGSKASSCLGICIVSVGLNAHHPIRQIYFKHKLPQALVEVASAKKHLTRGERRYTRVCVRVCMHVGLCRRQPPSMTCLPLLDGFFFLRSQPVDAHLVRTYVTRPPRLDRPRVDFLHPDRPRMKKNRLVFKPKGWTKTISSLTDAARRTNSGFDIHK